MDCCHQHIDLTEIWKGEVVLKMCKTLQEIPDLLKKYNDTITNLLLCVGMSEMEVNSPGYVDRHLVTLVRYLYIQYPTLKLALCELTPRNDKYDEQVASTNKLLRKSFEMQPNLVLIPHENLEKSDFISDSIFTTERTERYVLNMREGLEKLSNIRDIVSLDDGSSDATSECFDDSEYEGDDLTEDLNGKNFISCFYFVTHILCD